MRKDRLRLLGIAGVLAPAAMVAAGFVLSWLLRREFPAFLPLPGWRTLLFGAVTAGLSLGMINLLPHIDKRFERALRESGTRVGEEALLQAGYPVMLVVVVMAGVGEEVLFRGALQPSIGVLPAALVFGFSHGGWRFREMWAYVAAASLSGGLFGLVYWLTGDLWVVIIAHAVHNILSTLMLGKKVDFAPEWPFIRLVPEEPVAFGEPDLAELEHHRHIAATIEGESQHDISYAEPEFEPGCEPECGALEPEPGGVGDPVPDAPDSPDDGPDDRDPANRPPE